MIDIFLHPSIHFLLLIQGQVRVAAGSAKWSRRPSPPATLSSSSGWIPRYIIPPACSGSTPGSPASWTCLEHLHRKAPRRHPDQMPEPPLFDTKEQWLYSEPISLRLSTATLQRKLISATREQDPKIFKLLRLRQ